MDDNDLEAILQKYEGLRPRYERLVAEVCRILQAKLETGSLSPVSVHGRTKDPQNFKEKISRKNYRDPLNQATDLAATRVVCKYESDLEEALSIIGDNFNVCEHVDKSRELGVDKMGYNGKSVIITLGDRYSGFHYDGITDLKCEIQVRTVLQDAWAIIEHQLIYKSEDTIPLRLRRDINNVASLLEIAQGVFDIVRENARLT